MENTIPLDTLTHGLFEKHFDDLKPHVPLNAITLLSDFEKLEGEEKPLSRNLKNHYFALSNRDHIDILELKQKFDTDNIFCYYLANVVKVSDSITNRIIIEIYSAESEKPEKPSDRYNKKKIYLSYCYYMFSLNLYRPVKDKDNGVLFDEYKRWIDSEIMRIKKPML